MNLRRTLSFVVDDSRWMRKILLGALFALLSPLLVGFWLLLGYALEVLRRVAADREDTLPDWKPLKGYLLEGLKGCAIMTLYSLPFVLLEALAAVLRHLVAPVLAPQVVNPIATVLGIVAVLLGLYGAYLLMGALTRLAIMGSLRQALSPGLARAAIERAPSMYAVVFFGGILGVLALWLGGSLLLGIGVLVGAAWTAPYLGHLLGQAEKFAVNN